MKNSLNDYENCYTLIEIITGLRSEYQISRNLLDRLKNYIRIDNDNVNYYFSIQPNEEQYIYNDNFLQLILHVSKTPTSVLENIRHKLNQYNFGENRWLIDNIAFYFEEVNGNLSFYPITNSNLKNSFKPTISIINIKQFIEIYNQIKYQKLSLLPNVYIDINPYQSLLITKDIISLSSIDGKGRHIDIIYNSIEDKIIINSSANYSQYFIEKLLHTKIPKYELPYNYISLINKSNEKTNELFLEEPILKKKEHLQINSTGKKLILSKK